MLCASKYSFSIVLALTVSTITNLYNECQNLWIERTTYTTECELPGILKWFEVVEQRIEQLCPPQYACETVERNNKQIRQVMQHYRANPQVCMERNHSYLSLFIDNVEVFSFKITPLLMYVL